VNRWRVILATVVIFLAGAATGGVVVRTYAPKIVKRMHISPPLPIGQDRRDEYLAKLDRELQLTPDQRVQVAAILSESQTRMKELWEPVEPQVKEEYRRTRREIFEVLTPEQQAKMKQWHKDKDKDKESKPGEKSTNTATQHHCTKDSCCL
jgi:Spy/CpxP family protein refolding chaperone